MIKQAIMICVAVSVFSGCQKKEIQYQSFEVVQKDLQKEVEVNGSIETINTVDVFAPITGRLEKMLVNEGDMVFAKQKIATMSSDNRSTIIDMAAGKSEKEVEYWKSQLLLTPIYSPVSGKVILLKARNTGEKVSGSVAQISTGEVIRANVDENDLIGMEIGKDVDVRFDINPKKSLNGKLQKISQTSKLVNNVNVYQVEVSVPDEKQRSKLPFDIKIGMSVTLYFPIQEKKGVKALPITAVNGKSLTNVTLLKENGTETKVKLGDVYGDFVEVVSGLEMGEKIKVPAFNTGQGKVRKSPLIKKD